MHSAICLRFLTAIIICVSLSGCYSTIKQQKESELAVLTQAAGNAQTTLADLKAGTVPPEYDLHLFVSFSLVNRALEHFDGIAFPLPQDPSITITVRSVRVATYGASPTASVKAIATKGDLDAELDIGAALLPSSDPAEVGKFKLAILSFTPIVRWTIFEPTKAEFVRTLLRVKLDEIASRLPALELPVSKAVELGAKASSRRITIQTSDRPSTIDVLVTLPSTYQQKTLVVGRYLFLNDGVHMFGVLK
jgi:hypothetical protein